MATDGKEAERRRLAEALRANLKRRKTAAKPARDMPGSDAANREAAASEADRPAPGDRG